MRPIIPLSTAVLGASVAFFVACGDKESTTNPGTSSAVTTTTATTTSTTSTSTAGGQGTGGQGTGGKGAGGQGTGGKGTGGQGTGGQGTGGQGTGGGGGGGAQSLCLKTGGTENTQKCCAAAGDFPNTCSDGACTCAPNSSVDTKVCDCVGGYCYDPAKGCVAKSP